MFSIYSTRSVLLCFFIFLMIDCSLFAYGFEGAPRAVDSELEATPTAVCLSNVNVSVGNTCEVIIEPAFIDGGSFDPDGDELTLSVDLTTPVGPGEYFVTLTVSDGSSSNNCFSTVTVEDKSFPTAVCIANLVISISSDGTATLFSEDVDGGSFDNCDLTLSFADGPVIYDCSDVGTTDFVTLLVEDEGGNTNSCFTNVEVQDPGGFCPNTAPVAVCVETLLATVNDDCIVEIFPENFDAGSFDPDGDPLTFMFDLPAPITEGEYTVTLTVSDGELSNNCMSTLIVDAPDNDGDGVSACAGDCDDDNADTYPGAPEIIDGTDNDCDDAIDEPQAINAANRWIEAVELNTIENASGNNGGYADFTELSTTVNAGEEYLLTLTPGFLNNAKKVKWRVYVDLDQDGFFANGQEKIVQTKGKNPKTVTFTLPEDTPTGTTRLRILMNKKKFRKPYEDSFNGEVEDYTINVVSSSALQAAPVPHVVSETTETLGIYPEISTERLVRDKITLAPNPADHAVTINTPTLSEDAELSIMDQLGRVIYRQSWTTGLTAARIDLNHPRFVPGIYFVVLQTEVDRYVERLLVVE